MIHDHPDPVVRWRHRRRLAYIAMFGLIGYPALFLLADSPHLAAVAWPVMAALGSVVGVYTGASTWESVSISKGGAACEPPDRDSRRR